MGWRSHVEHHCCRSGSWKWWRRRRDELVDNSIHSSLTANQVTRTEPPWNTGGVGARPGKPGFDARWVTTCTACQLVGWIAWQKQRLPWHGVSQTSWRSSGVGGWWCLLPISSRCCRARHRLWLGLRFFRWRRKKIILNTQPEAQKLIILLFCVPPCSCSCADI